MKIIIQANDLERDRAEAIAEDIRDCVEPEDGIESVQVVSMI